MAGREQQPGPGTNAETTPTPETRLEAPTTGGGTGKTSKASKRKKNRQRKHRNRRQSFLVPASEESHDRPGTASGTGSGNQMEGDRPTSRENPQFYNFVSNLSTTSLDSDALLDHR
jgi:magnesium transporter